MILTDEEDHEVILENGKDAIVNFLAYMKTIVANPKTEEEKQLGKCFNLVERVFKSHISIRKLRDRIKISKVEDINKLVEIGLLTLKEGYFSRLFLREKREKGNIELWREGETLMYEPPFYKTDLMKFMEETTPKIIDALASSDATVCIYKRGEKYIAITGEVDLDEPQLVYCLDKCDIHNGVLRFYS